MATTNQHLEHDETDMSDPDEREEVRLGREIISAAANIEGEDGNAIRHAAQQLIDLHVPKPKVAEAKPRDDISSLRIPASSKAYARLKGAAGTNGKKKSELYTKTVADLVNHGRQDFKNREVVQSPKWPKFKRP